jgi:hypothetical protein
LEAAAGSEGAAGLEKSSCNTRGPPYIQMGLRNTHQPKLSRLRLGLCIEVSRNIRR